MTDTITSAVDPIVQSVDTTVASTLSHPGPFTEIGLAIPVLVIVIALHGWFLSRITRRFSRSFGRFTHDTPRWRINLLTSGTVSALALAHLLETIVWSLPISYLGLTDTFRHAYSYTLQQYTTLGAGSVTIPDGWGLLGPMIAMSGLFAFGWTGSVLVYVMGEVAKWHGENEK